MFLTVILLMVAFAIVLAVKARFDSLPDVARFSLLMSAALITAFVFTIEFFIWLKARLQEFLDAIEGLPWWVVVGIFVLLVVVCFRTFRFLAAIDKQEIGRMFRENVTPHLREMATDVREAWKKRRTFRLWPRWRRRSDDGDDTAPPS